MEEEEEVTVRAKRRVNGSWRLLLDWYWMLSGMRKCQKRPIVGQM